MPPSAIAGTLRLAGRLGGAPVGRAAPGSDRVIFALLLALITLAPLPFIADRSWTPTLLAAGTGLLLVVTALMASMGRLGLAMPPRAVLASGTLVAAAALWAGAQAAPFLPASWEHPLWSLAREALPAGAAGAVSLDPATSDAAATALWTAGAVFLLSLQFGRSRQLARWALTAVMGAGLLCAAIDLGIALTDRFASLPRSIVGADSTELGLGLIAALALLIGKLDDAREPGVSVARSLAALCETLLAKSWPSLVALLMIAPALWLSQNLSAPPAVAAGALALLLAALVAPSLSIRASRARLLLVGGIAVGLAVAGAAADIAKPDRPEADAERRAVIDLAGRAAADAPWLGSGAGTFADAVRPYRDARIAVAPAHAGNDYLELAVELGFPAAGALVAGIAGLGLICVAGVLRRRRDAIYPCAGAAAALLVGIEAFLGSGLRLPAAAAAFAALLGVAVAQSFRTAESGRRD